jgi:hypothetical protein
MPLDLDELAAPQDAVIEYKGHTIKLKINPDAYSPALETKAMAASANEGSGAYWGKILASLIVEWDVTRKKKPVPLTAEALAELGFPLLMHLYKEIVKKILPPATPETNSGSSF